MAILLKCHITDVLKYICCVADGAMEFPLSVRGAVTSNNNQIQEIIDKYETCTQLRTTEFLIKRLGNTVIIVKISQISQPKLRYTIINVENYQSHRSKTLYNDINVENTENPNQKTRIITILMLRILKILIKRLGYNNINVKNSH